MPGRPSDTPPEVRFPRLTTDSAPIAPLFAFKFVSQVRSNFAVTCFCGLWCKFDVACYSGVLDRLIGGCLVTRSKPLASSGSVTWLPPSLPVLNCPFLIFSASSTPLITTAAVRKLFRPKTKRVFEKFAAVRVKLVCAENRRVVRHRLDR